MKTLILVSLGAMYLATADEQQPFGIERRIPWTTSRLVGSPDPPLPYTVEKTFTNITWKRPIYLEAEPGSDRLWVVQQGGEKDRPSKILRVRGNPSASSAETFIVVSNRLIYSVAFHPGYRTNGQWFMFSNGQTSKSPRTNRVSRFDSESEQVIIEWRSEGHDGGGMVFGHDGMLYISTGDGTSDSDTWVTGQDLSELLGSVLRIDVDHPDGTRPYSVPRDNPFVGMTNARPENWAYGLRNPWRLCIDQKTGQIWAGNNGQDLWETAHLIRRGENYGWSVYEGSHPFYLNRKTGPTPVVAPTLEHSHSEARSLTGGVVYYGDELSELNGVYVYGDHSTGKIWGARHNGSRVVWHKELADTELQIAAFAVSHRGELLIVDNGGGLYRLVRSPSRKTTQKFPTRLSETGLFASTKNHQPDPALIPYSVNAPAWNDGASAERFMALPDESRIGRFTNGATLMQTMSLQGRRVETRLLLQQDGQWAGYSYRWNDRQTDATLVAAKGEEKELNIKGARQVWRFPSRTECLTCHSRAAEFALGMNELQLNKVHDYGAVRDDQLRTLKHIGVFTGKPGTNMLVDPYDTGQTLDARARSYLHVNCSVCHVEAGGGNSKMDLRFTVKPERMDLFSARPQHDTFGIDNAMLIFPGDPDRSILNQRVSRRGRGQMPPLVTSIVDERAVALFRDWIREMKPEQTFVRDWKVDDLLPSLEQIKDRSFESGRTAFRQTGCMQCHRFAGEGGSVGPDLSGIGRRLSPRELLESIVLPSKVITEGYATTEIETKSGEVIAGRIEREDDRVLVMRPPTATEEMVTIRKSDIRQRALSKTSNMPTGMINTLQEADVLDLLAYLMADVLPPEPVER